MKKVNQQEHPLAWSSKMWVAIQRTFVKPSLRDGLSELEYLYRAILKNKNNTVRVLSGGGAVWDSISAVELAKWNMTLSVWGWGPEKVITWSPEIEAELIRASIRIFALHPDGPLPKVMCDGAESRKKWLLQKLNDRLNLPFWRKLNAVSDTLTQRHAKLDSLSPEELLRLGHDAKEFYNAYCELDWKNKTSQRIHNWLLRKGTIPLAISTKWTSVWQWSGALEETSDSKT